MKRRIEIPVPLKLLPLALARAPTILVPANGDPYPYISSRVLKIPLRPSAMRCYRLRTVKSVEKNSSRRHLQILPSHLHDSPELAPSSAEVLVDHSNRSCRIAKSKDPRRREGELEKSRRYQVKVTSSSNRFSSSCPARPGKLVPRTRTLRTLPPAPVNATLRARLDPPRGDATIFSDYNTKTLSTDTRPKLSLPNLPPRARQPSRLHLIITMPATCPSPHDPHTTPRRQLRKVALAMRPTAILA